MSVHEIPIVEIQEITPHSDPTVERMEITQVFGWQCCVGKGQFKPGDKAIYVPPDYEVPTSRPEFAFLTKEGKEYERIRVKRLKGALSQGLLIPVPAHLKHLPVGSNVIDYLDIRRYEPSLPMSTGGQFVSPPDLWVPVFDVENFQRYPDIFQEGEPVVVTEKMHGANARFVYAKNKNGEWQQFCGSRTNWLAEDDKNIWWRAFRLYPEIGEWCERHPEMVLYGEIFGNVQSLKYGAKKNELFFAAFSILDKNSWVDFNDCLVLIGASNMVYFTDTVSLVLIDGDIQWAPVLYTCPFQKEKILALAEQDSMWPGANHASEGVVISPEKERTHEEIGRVCLKMVSNRYLEHSK